MTSASPALISSMTAIEPRPLAVERCALEGDLESLHAESWGWALTCCARDRDLAEEVLQVAYLRIVSGRARFSGKSSFKTWVFGVIRMTARSERRRAWLWSTRHQRTEAARDVADSAIPADRHVEDDERTVTLARALARLSRRQREVLQLTPECGSPRRRPSSSVSSCLNDSSRPTTRRPSRSSVGSRRPAVSFP
jgi:RNA polymerase sigma-70 factor (ECF subfamily)